MSASAEDTHTLPLTLTHTGSELGYVCRERDYVNEEKERVRLLGVTDHVALESHIPHGGVKVPALFTPLPRREWQDRGGLGNGQVLDP